MSTERRQTTSGRLTLPLKWFIVGGKYYLAPRINAIIATRPHIHYVEPYAGGLATLLQWDGFERSELVNDLNGRLTNFWNVLRSPETFKEFYEQVTAIPMSRNEWDLARLTLDAPDPIAAAVSFFVWCRQSYSGNCKGFTHPTRTRLRRGMNGNVSEWIGAVDGLPAIHARLRSVFVETMPALQLIRREDGPATLQYLDPPYHPETVTSDDGYAFMMTAEDHASLVSAVLECEGSFVLSGYPHPSYDDRLTASAGWTRHAFDLPNNAAGGKAKRRMQEVVWCNF